MTDIPGHDWLEMTSPQAILRGRRAERGETLPSGNRWSIPEGDRCGLPTCPIPIPPDGPSLYYCSADCQDAVASSATLRGLYPSGWKDWRWQE